MRARFFLLLLASLVTVSACGGGGPSGDGDAGGPIDVLNDDDARDPSACERSTCRPGQVLQDCVCIPEPRMEAALATCAGITTSGGMTRTPDEDFCIDGAAGMSPDLSCFTTARRPPPADAGTRLVTLYGVVDVFGNGPDANDVRVEVYREGADAMLGEMIGMAVSSTASPCMETEIEIEGGEPTGEERNLGYYAIEGVPTEVPLIVVTRPSAGDEGLWKDLYTYNIVVLDDEVEASPPSCDATLAGTGFHEYRARVLSVSDYRTIPVTASLSAGIRSGNGAIAGEVHDCGNVRVALAQVGISPQPEALTYFTNDADNPIPELSRVSGTSLLGLYAGLDLPEGPVDVSAVGRVGDEVVSLGWYRARIFPNSVTSVSLRGLRPHQVQAD